MDETPSSLQSLTAYLPTKVSPLLDHMRDLTQKLIDKGLLEFTYVHQLLYEYVIELERNDKLSKIEDLVNQLSESLLKLITTKPGARMVCTLITHASAKDRKRMMKCIKGHVVETLLHPAGHLALARLVQVTDDVVNIQKMILSEIRSLQPEIKYTASGEIVGTPLPVLIQLAKHPMGHKFLLSLLTPSFSKAAFEPDEVVLFAKPSPTSKKTDEARRKEHLLNMKSTITTLTLRYLPELVRDRCGSKVVAAVVSTFYPSALLRNVARTMVELPLEFDATSVSLVEEQGGDEEEENFYDQEEEYVGEEEAEGGAEGDGDAEVDDDADAKTEPLGEIDEGGEGDYDEEGIQEYEALADEILVEQPNKGTKRKLAEVSDAAPELPIHEHTVVNVMVKLLLHLESAYEGQSASAGAPSEAVDSSLWDSSQSSESLAKQLLQLVKEQGKLTQWFSCNRACFLLAGACEVPSAQALAKELLRQDAAVYASIKAVSQTSQGGKVLLEKVDKL